MLRAAYFLGQFPTANYYSLQKPSHGQIPLFFDARWRDARPHKNTEGYWPIDKTTTDGMPEIAIKRHGRVANVSFLDGSTRTIPLPELWNLQWEPARTPPTMLPKVPW
ncbi:MAG TPA: hypothetical protein VLI90_17265 [Tepidisphaeraceae bacterium]|nr:hypothetical protein [Tepidisphaeraceae bacterium]